MSTARVSRLKVASLRLELSCAVAIQAWLSSDVHPRCQIQARRYVRAFVLLLVLYRLVSATHARLSLDMGVTSKTQS